MAALRKRIHITNRIILKCVLLLGYITVINCHPQCLDFKPPYDQEQTLEFCSDYVGVSCCSVEQDMEIKARYDQIKTNVRAAGISGCESYIKELLCQECSPYAAHIFDAEENGIPREFPGLCNTYCNSFYEKCRDVVPYIYNTNTNLSGQLLQEALQSKSAFCSAVSLVDTDYCFPELRTNAVLNGGITRETRNEDGCLCLEEFADKLANPLLFRMAPDNSGRIYIGQQFGVVDIYYKNGTREYTPFLNIATDVLLSSRSGDERGLLNLIFHPEFKSNKKFYIYFSTTIDDQHYIRISEMRESIYQPNKADRNFERVILEVKQPYSNHNGGEMFFDEDGYLFAFLGDGGAAGDPKNNAQDKSVLLGKVLRIDVNTDDPSVSYVIPPDNPFVGESGARGEVWAYGVRNIWRCDIDEGHPVTGYGKGRIICGDVGQSAYEEIDIIVKGGNYGWKGREGFACYDNTICRQLSEEELPIFAYSHSDGKSVTGGHVYRGCMNPNLQGKYIYGDYVNGRLWALTENQQTKSWTNQELLMCKSDVCFNGLVGEYQKNIMSFGEDDNGEIYMLTTSNPSSTVMVGKVYKIVDPKRRGDPTTCRTYIPPPTTTTTSDAPSTSEPDIETSEAISAPTPVWWWSVLVATVSAASSR